MNTLNFLDSNVWLALIGAGTFIPKGPFLVRGSTEQQFFFCRFTQLTVLRLLTTESVMAKETKTMSEAWALWDRVWAIRASRFCPSPTVSKRNFVRVRRFPAISKLWPMPTFSPSQPPQA